MSSVRGMDLRDGVKTERDQQRYNISYDKDVDKRRPDTFLKNPKDGFKLKSNKPVISMRGSDERHQIIEGRKKAQYNKANTTFMSHTQPVDTKIQQGIYF